MASPKEYLDFILEQLSDLDEISFRAMMPNADMELPYDDAKQMILVDDVDNRGDVQADSSYMGRTAKTKIVSF